MFMEWDDFFMDLDYNWWLKEIMTNGGYFGVIINKWNNHFLFLFFIVLIIIIYYLIY